MRTSFPFAVFGAVSVLALGVATDASAAYRLLSDGPQIELRDMVARVVVTPEERGDIDIRVRYGKAKVPTLMVSHRGNVTVLNGHLGDHSHDDLFSLNINFDGEDRDVSFDKGMVYVDGLGKVSVDDLPLVYIRVPSHAVVKDNSDSLGHVNAAQSLDLVLNGGGQWTVDPVNGPLNIISCGSTDLKVTAAANAIVDNMGSGDIELGAVRGLKVTLAGSGDFISHQSTVTDLQNMGSGDVSLGRVGDLKVQLAGSGDLSLDSVSGRLQLSNFGSSDVSINRLSGGPAVLELAGSGDVVIAGGQVPAFTLSGSGSGDVDFNGITNTVRIDSNGSGDVTILKATGTVVTNVNGAGEMHIGH